MIKRHVLWLFSVLVLSVATLHADGIPGDPVIQIDDPTCPQTGCQQVSAATPFTFSSNAAGGGTTVFQVNPDSAGFSTLDIETVGTFQNLSDVQCFSNAFNHCSVSFLNGVTDIFLFNTCQVIEGACPGGFAPGTVFDIDLDNLVLDSDGRPIFDQNGVAETTQDVGGWGPNRGFNALAGLTTAPTTARISAPEPSSIFLLLTGAAALVARRKLLKG
ncbi:MAG TPA: PEP-CTERM sorting domain-containing protein [Terriglobales bacterium]|nr:PEP-CTERM sorting domain-containing protein [Terriglobales bacterium]